MFSGAEWVSSWVALADASNAGSNGLYTFHCLYDWGLIVTFRTDALSKRVKNEGQKPRWGQQDAFILVHKCVLLLYIDYSTILTPFCRIDSLNVRDDTEIDWKVIPDPDWNLWSPHTLQRRWLTMKKGVKGYEDMTHQGKVSFDFLFRHSELFFFTFRNHGYPQG